MMNEVQSQGMTTSQKIEKYFFLNLISLVNEVQGKTKLPSQFNQKNKSVFKKQIKSQKQDKSAFASI